jgi:single-strand DNA-binding protein
MSSVNKCTIVGFLGADPELRFVPSGAAVCNLRIATDESYKDKAGVLQKRTEWHRVTVWGKNAESCGKYLSKGRQVLVEGKLQTRSYEKDGQKHFVTEIVAVGGVTFLGKGNGVVNQTPAHDNSEMDVPV